jgi:hypothetical protein
MAATVPMDDDMRRHLMGDDEDAVVPEDPT